MKQVEDPARAEQRVRSALARKKEDASAVGRWRIALTLALFAGDLERSLRILREAVVEVPAVVAFDEILAPAMHNIGDLWEQGQLTIADEHAAAAIARRLIEQVADALRPAAPPPERGLALLATPPSERHTAGLEMAAAVLRAAGYAVVYLGSDLPLRQLRGAVARHMPALVAVSATLAAPGELQETLRTVLAASPDTQLLVGGAGAKLAPGPTPFKMLSGMQALAQELGLTGAERGTGSGVGSARPVPANRVLGPVEAPPGSGDWLQELVSPGSDADRARRALLEVAEQMSHSASWMWDTGSDRLIWSDNVFRILDFDPAESPPSIPAFLERVHPADRERIAELLRAAPAGRTIDHTYRIITRPGKTRFVHAVTAVQLTRPGGKVLVGWLQDLSDHAEAERQIAAHIAVTEVLRSWSSFDLDGRELLTGLARALGFCRVALWLPVGDLLVPRLQWDENDQAAFDSDLQKLRLRRGEGMAGRAWEQQAPVTVADAGPEMSAAFRTVALKRGLRGGLALPLTRAGDTIGVLSFAGPDVVDLDDRLRATLAGIAHEIGTFLGSRLGELRGPLLSARELEVLQLAADGLSGPEIAAHLHVSPATVKTHFENIYGKYDVSDRVAAVAKALREGLIR